MGSTVEVINWILQADPNIRSEVVTEINAILKEEDEFVSEPQAAKILMVSHTTLNRWRNGRWPNAPTAFPFTVTQAVTGRIRYSKRELDQYVRFKGPQS